MNIDEALKEITDKFGSRILKVARRSPKRASPKRRSYPLKKVRRSSSSL